jgi:plasmid maintenance system killer protein
MHPLVLREGGCGSKGRTPNRSGHSRMDASTLLELAKAEDLCYPIGNSECGPSITSWVMTLHVADRKLKEALEDDKACRKRFGIDMSKKIRLRLTALRAAESLADFWPPYSGPERCHELKAELVGTFSMDLKHPYRLLFRENNPVNQPEGQDGKVRWRAIEAINIIGIEDTHG